MNILQRLLRGLSKPRPNQHTQQVRQAAAQLNTHLLAKSIAQTTPRQTKPKP